MTRHQITICMSMCICIYHAVYILYVFILIYWNSIKSNYIVQYTHPATAIHQWSHILKYSIIFLDDFTNSHWHWGKYLGLANLPPQHDRSESPRDFSPFSLWDRTTSRRPACYVCVARCPRSSVYPWWSWALFVRDFHRLGWWETTFHSAHSCHLSQSFEKSQYEKNQLQHIEVKEGNESLRNARFPSDWFRVQTEVLLCN